MSGMDYHYSPTKLGEFVWANANNKKKNQHHGEYGSMRYRAVWLCVGIQEVAPA